MRSNNPGVFPSVCNHVNVSTPISLFIPQGILLVYDITNGWSFDGIDRWIREIDEVIPFDLFLVDKENIGNTCRRGHILCVIPVLRKAIVCFCHSLHT